MKVKIYIFISLFILSSWAAFCSLTNYKFETLVSGLHIPWELIQIDSLNVVFTQRNGYVHKFNLATRELKQILNVSAILEWGEGGLLGMAIHPDYPFAPYLYLVYNYRSFNDYKEKVVRYRFENDTLFDPVVILDNIRASSIHNGSRLLITKDNKLLITTGDAGIQLLSQDTDSLNGKLLRINLDGSIPNDNPFGNEVWSFGHRNAQGLVEVGDKIFISEHGPDTDDEINLIVKGGNYGWPFVRGYCDDNYPNEKNFCRANTIVEPLISLYPDRTLAVCGLDYYDQEKFPQLKNSLLLVTLKTGLLLSLRLNESQDKILSIDTIINNTYGRIRFVRILKDGNIIIGTSNGSNDKLILITTEDDSLINENSNSFYPQIIFGATSLKVYFESNTSFQKASIRIYDFLGRLISKTVVNSNIVEIQKPYNLTDTGIFFLRIITPQKIIYRKFLW